VLHSQEVMDTVTSRDSPQTLARWALATAQGQQHTCRTGRSHQWCSDRRGITSWARPTSTKTLFATLTRSRSQYMTRQTGPCPRVEERRAVAAAKLMSSSRVSPSAGRRSSGQAWVAVAATSAIETQSAKTSSKMTIVNFMRAARSTLVSSDDLIQAQASS